MSRRRRALLEGTIDVMAQHVSVLLVDDLDGSVADRTVTFALDGRRYEIDLNADHERLLRAALEPFIDGARRAGRSEVSAHRRRTLSARDTRTGPPDREEGRTADSPPDGQPPTQPEVPATSPAVVPPAHFSNPVTHAATRRGTATRPGSVEIFTHRA
jgi:hypothetical protein